MLQNPYPSFVYLLISILCQYDICGSENFGFGTSTWSYGTLRSSWSSCLVLCALPDLFCSLRISISLLIRRALPLYCGCAFEIAAVLSPRLFAQKLQHYRCRCQLRVPLLYQDSSRAGNVGGKGKRRKEKEKRGSSIPNQYCYISYISKYNQTQNQCSIFTSSPKKKLGL